MPSQYTYQQYVELLDLDLPSMEPSENIHLNDSLSNSSNSLESPPSWHLIIVISVMANIFTVCCLFGICNCVRGHLKERYLAWRISSYEKEKDNDTADDNILFDDIYA
jgi:hypothetical protein